MVASALKGNALTLSVPGQPVYDLVPEVGGEFSFKLVKVVRVRFVEDAKGQVSAVGLGVLFPCIVPLDGAGRALHPAILYSDQRSVGVEIQEPLVSGIANGSAVSGDHRVRAT
jgi:hypothetical protein